MPEPKMTMDADGTKQWYFNGKFHRTDGPAVEWVNGMKQWYLDGKRVTASTVFWAAAQVGNAVACNNLVENWTAELKNV